MNAPAGSASVATPLVLIVDDDEAIREALTDLLRSVGIEAKSFGSTRELLDTAPSDRPGCLILDVRLPGISGLDLQAQLTHSGNTRPIIFMTGHGDIPMSVRAMKAGAMDFLTKPFRDQDMLETRWPPPSTRTWRSAVRLRRPRRRRRWRPP
jgi:FixJ family two-component response regulator